MAIYRFKVCFEEDDEVIRVIEIRSGQTLEDLHFAILSSIEFDSKHNALLYISDDYWKKHDGFVFLPGEKWEELPPFSGTKLNRIINDPHQKILYIYDLIEEWTFHIELVGISINEDATKSYPMVVRSESKAPKQYKNQRKVGADLEDDEFEYLTKNLLSGEIATEMMAAGLDEGEADHLDEEDMGEGGESSEEDSEEELFDDDAFEEI